MIGIAVAIVFTYIKPTLTEMSAIQDDIAMYVDTNDKAQEYNNELQNLINISNSYSVTELQLLERFLPSTVDEVAVLQEIETLARKSAVNIVSLSVGEASEPTDDVQEIQSTSYIPNFDELGNEIPYDPTMDALSLPSQPGNDPARSLTSHIFDVEVTGGFTNLQQFVIDLETNIYPLHVTSFEIAAGDDDNEGVSGGTYGLTLELITYSYSNI